MMLTTLRQRLARRVRRRLERPQRAAVLVPIIDTERARGRTYRVAAFDHEGETLWGLSGRITLQLLELLGLGSPAPRAPDPAEL